MRAIPQPTLDPISVYKICIKSITNIGLQTRLAALTKDVGIAAEQYKRKGKVKELYTILPNECGDRDFVLGEVTKQELTAVYSSQMVKAKSGRAIYDLLLSAAPLGRCPFCGTGHATTLDHYLPKSRYPQLAVTPLNLVPACKDCNTGKRSSIAKAEAEQILHPYFDHGRFVSEQWLFAEVVRSHPNTVRYYAKPPDHWDSPSQARVHAHFEQFDLGNRYTIEAANELAGREDFIAGFKRDYGTFALIELLKDEARSHARGYKNSWQTAFYQALADFYENEISERDDYIRCPICEGERVFESSPCVHCNGDGWVSHASLMRLDYSKYDRIPCFRCDGRPGCALCGGSRLVDREKALRITRNRS